MTIFTVGNNRGQQGREVEDFMREIQGWNELWGKIWKFLFEEGTRRSSIRKQDEEIPSIRRGQTTRHCYVHVGSTNEVLQHGNSELGCKLRDHDPSHHRVVYTGKGRVVKVTLFTTKILIKEGDSCHRQSHKTFRRTRTKFSMFLPMCH